MSQNPGQRATVGTTFGQTDLRPVEARQPRHLFSRLRQRTFERRIYPSCAWCRRRLFSTSPSQDTQAAWADDKETVQGRRTWKVLCKAIASIFQGNASRYIVIRWHVATLQVFSLPLSLRAKWVPLAFERASHATFIAGFDVRNALPLGRRKEAQSTCSGYHVANQSHTCRNRV